MAARCSALVALDIAVGAAVGAAAPCTTSGSYATAPPAGCGSGERPRNSST